METVFGAIGSIFQFVFAIIYDPVYFVYDLLPFSEALSAWRTGFLSTYFQTYLLPIFFDIAISIGFELLFGAVVGSVFDFLGNAIALAHFFENFLAGMLFLIKGVVEFPIFLVVGLAPYILPLVIALMLLGFVLNLLGTTGRAAAGK